jgi:hypothetical protein
MRYLCVDPGIRHLAAVVVDCTGEPTRAHVLYANTFDVGGAAKKGRRPPIDEERLVKGIVEIIHVFVEMEVDRFIVERQPSIFRRPAGQEVDDGSMCMSQRLNTVENMVFGAFIERCKVLPIKVSPLACKRYFQAALRNYAANKTAAKRVAGYIVGYAVKSDHIADCILLGVYYFETQERVKMEQEKEEMRESYDQTSSRGGEAGGEAGG